jgi:hypothetical protein
MAEKMHLPQQLTVHKIYFDNIPLNSLLYNFFKVHFINFLGIEFKELIKKKLKKYNKYSPNLFPTFIDPNRSMSL